MHTFELEVLWHTDATKKLEDLGIDVDIKDVTTKKVSFTGISHFVPFKWENERDLTKIYTLCGEDYLSPLPYNEFKKLLSNL